MSRVWVVLVAVAAAAVVTVLPFTRPDPGRFAYDWYWANHGVGNFAATVIVGALGVWKVVREWRKHRATQGALILRLDHIIKHHPDIPDLPDVSPGGRRR